MHSKCSDDAIALIELVFFLKAKDQVFLRRRFLTQLNFNQFRLKKKEREREEEKKKEKDGE